MNKSELKADLQELINENPTEFSWNSQPHTGILSPRSQTEVFQDEGGRQVDYELNLYCLFDNFENGVPAIGDKVTAGSKNFRIVGIEIDDLKVGVDYALMSIER